MHRVRAPLLAVVVLALAAGAALAGGGPPPAAVHGLDTARDASGVDVPMGRGIASELQEESEDPTAEEQEEPADDPLEAEDDKTEAGSDHCTVAEPGNHGALVCWAAQNPPAGWTGGHGAWVSCVARLSNTGHAVDASAGEAAEPVVWAELTPEACDEAIAAARDAKAAERDAAKAERDAAKAERAAERESAKAERAPGKAERTGAGKSRG
jgi:hypothetical protein